MDGRSTHLRGNDRRIIVDREADRYLWRTRGYQQHKRIHACIVRIDIIDGKLWIQQDNTEGIAPELERYGVPKEHIVLGFYSSDIRPTQDTRLSKVRLRCLMCLAKSRIQHYLKSEGSDEKRNPRL